MRYNRLTCVVLMIVCGGVIGVAYSSMVSGLWVTIGSQQRVAEWLVAIGASDRVVGYWSLVYGYIPEWVLVGGLGVAIGLTIRKKWLTASIACGVSYVAVPELVMFAITGADNPLQWFGWHAVLLRYFLMVSIPPVGVLSAFVAARVVQRRNKKKDASQMQV